MKSIYSRIGFLVIFCQAFFVQAQVGINTTTPSEAAVLHVESTQNSIDYGGFMPPRVSLAERNTIPVSAADDGLLVFLQEGSLRCVQIYDGVEGQWENVYCMPINSPPVATSVTYNGILEDGEDITASFTYTDADGDAAGLHIYTWYRADDAAGTNQTQIQTGTSNTYTLTTAELGLYVAVEVTPVALTGVSPGVPVLSVYNLISAGGIFISEIADPNNNAGARFIEITNGSGNPIDVTNWIVELYFNTNTTTTINFPFPTGTTIAAGDSYVIALNSTTFTSVYGFAPDAVDGQFDSNGDDTYVIRDDIGVIRDIIGVIGDDQTGTCAEFEDGRALRAPSVIEGNPVWDESEWIMWADSPIAGCTNHTNGAQDAPLDFTPGIHPN